MYRNSERYIGSATERKWLDIVGSREIMWEKFCDSIILLVIRALEMETNVNNTLVWNTIKKYISTKRSIYMFMSSTIYNLLESFTIKYIKLNLKQRREKYNTA